MEDRVDAQHDQSWSNLILCTICFFVFRFQGNQLHYFDYHICCIFKSTNDLVKETEKIDCIIELKIHTSNKLKQIDPLRYLAKIIILTVTLNKKLVLSHSQL